MTAQRWYSREADGAESGPYSDAELCALVRSGRVRRETPLRTDASRGWVVAEKVKGLPFVEPEPGRGPAAPRASSGRAGPVGSARTPVVDPHRGSTAPQAPRSGLATGAAWDNVSDYLADLSSRPETAGQDAPRPIPSAGPDATQAARPGPEGLDSSPARAADRSRPHQAPILHLLIDPRDAFGRALAPGMLAYSIGMIAATAVLYVLMWLPSLHGVERLRKAMEEMKPPSPPVDLFSGGGMMPRFPRERPEPRPVARPEPATPSPGMTDRVLTRLWEVGPRLLLAAGLALGAIGLLGTFATAVLSADSRPQPFRRGIAALGLSLTPLVCILPLALLMWFVATEIALLCAYFGVFVWALFYHEALQAIGGLPLNRAAYCSPVILSAGAYLLARCSVGDGLSLMMGGPASWVVSQCR